MSQMKSRPEEVLYNGTTSENGMLMLMIDPEKVVLMTWIPAQMKMQEAKSFMILEACVGSCRIRFQRLWEQYRISPVVMIRLQEMDLIYINIATTRMMQ
jgi:hypothetical protein